MTLRPRATFLLLLAPTLFAGDCFPEDGPPYAFKFSDPPPTQTPSGPTEYGRWYGEESEVVGARDGIEPTWDTMLAFRGSSRYDAEYADLYVGESRMLQAIEIPSGSDGADLHVESGFAGSGASVADYEARLDVWFFDGTLENLDPNPIMWFDALKTERGVLSSVTSDWGTTQVDTQVPAGTTFVVVGVSVIDRTVEEGHSEKVPFDGVYADGLVFELQQR